jgi:hypothetical protein
VSSRRVACSETAQRRGSTVSKGVGVGAWNATAALRRAREKAVADSNPVRRDSWLIRLPLGTLLGWQSSDPLWPAQPWRPRRTHGAAAVVATEEEVAGTLSL